jgi:hypothetical protein
MMLQSIWLILILCVTSIAHGDETSTPEPIIIPTEICRGYFLVPLTLAARDGYPSNRTLWFLHDTGASTSYVDPDSIERVSGQELRPGQTASLRNASAGALNFSRLPARVKDLDHLSIALGRPIDGLLSFDAFEDFLLTLDYQQFEMRVERGRLPHPDGQTVFDASGRDERPWMEVNFSNRQRRMLIDSGAALSGLVVNSLGRFETVEAPQVTGAAQRMRHIERRSTARAREDAHIGPHVLQTPTLQSTPGTELIGGRVMKHFVWTFDQSTRRVRMIRHSPHIPITFAPVYGHGMVLETDEDSFVVQDILPGTPASQADIQRGDQITHWNNRPVSDRGCGDTFNTRLSLRIKRGGTTFNVDLDLYPLVD